MAYPIEDKKQYTVAEYFEYEEYGEIRHEYYQGELYAMAGGSTRHNLLCQNVTFAFRGQKSSDCKVFMENVRLELLKNQYYVYPDVVLTCDEQDTKAEKLIQSPSIIVEVLSKSTEEYDKSVKLNYYLKLASLRFYILISQERYMVQVYEKRNTEWIFNIYTQLEEVLQLGSISLKMSDIYQDVEVNKDTIFLKDSIFSL